MKLYKSLFVTVWVAVNTTSLFASTFFSGGSQLDLDHSTVSRLMMESGSGTDRTFFEMEGNEYIRIDDMMFPVRKDAGFLSAFNGRKWTEGKVYYSFNSNVDSTNRERFRAAAAEWSTVADLEFIEGTESENYIYVVNSDRNSSYVGMIGGKQELNMYNWNYKFIIAHEIGHALGLSHEHQRTDRDTYVKINTQNIRSGTENNFNRRNTTDYGPYDFKSVMHYPPKAFSSNGGYTIYPQPGYEQHLSEMGNRSSLSQADIAGMISHYGSAMPENKAPNADAGKDQIVIDYDGNRSESITLNASSSFDSDGSIYSFVWKEGNTQIAIGKQPTINLSVGEHSITLTVTDNDGAKDTDNLLVSVIATLGVGETERYEAESATVSGAAIRADGSGSSGDGYVDYLNPSGDYIEWNVFSSFEGYVDLAFGYALAAGSRPLELRVNGALVNSNYTYPASGSWSTWLKTPSSKVFFNTGTNKIRLTAAGSSGGNFDYLEVISTPENQSPNANAGTNQTAIDSDNNGFESITLNGFSSFDSDGKISSYVWKEESTQIAIGPKPTLTFSVGIHKITLLVTDDKDATNTDTVVITITPFKETDENLIQNGSFSSGTDAWNTWSSGSASSTLSEENGEAVLNIQSGGSSLWEVNLTQGGLAIQQGETYELTLNARSPQGPKEIRAKIRENGNNWTVYAEKSFLVGPSMQNCAFNFTASVSDSQAQFVIECGGNDHDLILDDVSVARKSDIYELLIHSIKVTEAGTVLSWNSREGYVYDIKWTSNLMGGFSTLIDDLPATPPLNNYTDTGHNESVKGMYKIEERR